MANFSYLVVDTASKKGGYVDPGWDVPKILQIAKKEGVSIEKIVLTHTHFDHVKEVKAAFEALRVPIYVHGFEMGAIEEMGLTPHALIDDAPFQIGGLTVECLHCPGHTPGGLCFKIDRHLLTGDVLFVDGCGRVDLPGSDPEAMFATLQKLSRLPDETVIYPGHDYGPTPTDTLGHQKKTNPYLKAAMQGKEMFFGRRGV